ncbi:MAG: ATP-binding cassette domain-containing protein [Solirubrobacteraceae bacterium]
MRSEMVGALVPSNSRPGSHLRARDLRKGFGDGAVLDGVSLTVTAGQRVGVIGDNGVGKSTLLRLLAGKLVPDGGDVRWTTESRSFIEQEMDAPAGTTVASVHAEALRSPRYALAALQNATSGFAAGAEGAAERYAAALARAERLAAWDAERRLDAALNAFDAHFRPERTLASLSVGQRYRLRLGCALADPAGTVLLDEPSNHLDDSSLDRLVQWLLEFPGIAVFVTHDRWLLDAVATAIFDLDPARGGGGTLFGGSFRAYREERAGTLREWRRRYAASLDAERELSKRLIAARAAAPGHWQPGKGAAKHGRASRAASSVRLLQRRIDDLRRERGPAPPNPLTFTAPDAADTDDTVLLEATGIAVHGRVIQPSDSPIRLGARGRLLLRGANGAGKSTLLSVLARQLAPDTGTLTVAPGAYVGLLAQEDHWNPNCTPADVLSAWDLDQIRATGLLLDDDLGRPFGQLSVGQRRRVTLACVLLSRPSVLLLDEPTNHLSVTLVDELSDALLSTPAAVVVVTHDRTLCRTVHDWPTVTLSPVALAPGVRSGGHSSSPGVARPGAERDQVRSCITLRG